MSLDLETIYALVAVAIFLVVGFPVHEFAHAYAAYRLGDGTAKLFGRLTLNPIVHLDPLGAGILVLSALFGGFFIGWAKPTPVNPQMLRGRHGDSIVAAAGPVSNILMAAAAAVVIRVMVAVVGADEPGDALLFVFNVLMYFLYINIALFIFNLIPIPPLDGSHVLFDFLGPRLAWTIRPLLTRWGLVILLVVMVLPIGGQSLGARVMVPLMDGIAGLLVGF